MLLALFLQDLLLPGHEVLPVKYHTMQIYIHEGKTHTSRYALLFKRALDILTEYWFQCGRPKGILFPNQWTGEYLTPLPQD